MKKKPIATVVALAVFGGLTYSAVPSSSSAAAGQTAHVKHFVLTELGSHRIGPRAFGGADRIRNRATHKVVGFDSYTATFDLQAHVARLRVGIALKGGTLEGAVTQGENSNRFTGRVIGGTGAYKGARGTITGHSVGNTNRTIVTLKYSA